MLCHAGNQSPMSQSLPDAHVLQRSQRLTNFGELRNLGYRGLNLEHHEVGPVISNNLKDIHTASYEVLKIWLKKQPNRREAYRSLVDTLTECEMHMLVSELKQLTEEKSDHTKMSTERM